MYTTTCVCFLTFIAIFIVKYLKKCYSYWSDKNVPFLKTNLIFGNSKPLIWNKVPLIIHHENIYKQLDGHKFGGYFSFQRPILMIRDPYLIKNILIKDFNNFSSRIVDLGNFEPLRRHLFNENGEKWKMLRSHLTPSFSAMKVRNMFELFRECSKGLLEIIDEYSEKDIDFEVSDLMARYSTDVISSCAFGLNAHSLSDPESEFRKMGKKLLTPSFRVKIRRIIYSFSPKFANLLRLRVFDKNACDYFISIIENTIDFRINNQINRNDFLDDVIQLQRKNNFQGIDVLYIAAQCFAFFVAGFETPTGALKFALFELARNPDIQKKLQLEIDEQLLENEELTHEILKNMTFMDQVIYETLRLYPALPFLQRQCTSNYRIPDSDVIIDRGTTVIIPVYAIQRDPQVYDNPDVFNPDNFKRKSDRLFLSFGDGPRKCIGKQFGMLETKLVLATLLRKYNFSISMKMKLPPKYVSGNVGFTNIDGGIWLKSNARDKKYG